MTLFVVAYLAGVLTIVSPCILPVLPFVFARADRPFLRNGLPMLLGMALAFAAIASLAAVVGGWAVTANQYGRWAALVLLAVFGVALLVPRVAERLTRPVVALGNRWLGTGSAVVLGVATGLLWAPCAGPVLGLILTGAALQGANAQTSLLLLTYAAGAATSLALALVVGGRALTAMKSSLRASERIRQGLGALVLVAVVAVALGLDTGLLTKVSAASTTKVEQGLVDRFDVDAGQPAGSGPAMSGGAMMADGASGGLPVEGTMPSLDGATQWLNSKPLTTEDLRGKVVLVDFWTYSCVNCLRTIPHVRAWAEKYRRYGLVVVGVHTPEFAFEKDLGNVRKAAADLGVTYPIAIDNDHAIWRAFNNHYWPAHYFVDAKGDIRYHHFGEGSYDKSERVIKQLLAEAGRGRIPEGFATADVGGASAPANMDSLESPETYLGHARAERFVSPGGALKGTSKQYKLGKLRLNDWGLQGTWTIGPEEARLDAAGGAVSYRFHARDLNLVLGPGAEGDPVRFRISIDGKAPGAAAGVDVRADGSGVVSGQRLYQLVRQRGTVTDRTFEIEFLDPGAHAYAFTFG